VLLPVVNSWGSGGLFCLQMLREKEKHEKKKMLICYFRNHSSIPSRSFPSSSRESVSPTNDLNLISLI
jgi:hypothetical protein